MANLGNSKIKDTYQLLLQTDASGNLQKLDGTTPSPFIFNSGFTYNVGTIADGYVLISDGSGNASWGPVTFSGDVYISGGTIEGNTIKLNASSGGTISIPGLSWSANTNGSISNSPRNKNVGIGTPTPNEKLTVVGDISGSTDLHIGGDMYSGSTNLLDMFAKSGITNQDVYWSASTGGISNIDLTGNVGIGTSTPNEKLTVVGDISGTSEVHVGTTLNIQPNNFLKVGGNNMTYYQNTQAFFYQDLKMYDNKKLLLGTDGDMQIYFNGTNSFIDNNQGYLWIQSETLYLGDNTSNVTVQDNLTVNDNLLVNTDNLYVDATNQRVGIKTLSPDYIFTISGGSGFVPYDLQGGSAQFVNNQNRVLFGSGADTNGLTAGDFLQVTTGGVVYTVEIDSVDNASNITLTDNFAGASDTVSSLLFQGGSLSSDIFKVYAGTSPSFQITGTSIMSGTTDLLDIFAGTNIMTTTPIISATTITAAGDINVSGNTEIKGTLSVSGTTYVDDQVNADSFNATTITTGYKLNSIGVLRTSGGVIQVGAGGQSLNLMGSTTLTATTSMSTPLISATTMTLRNHLGVSGTTSSITLSATNLTSAGNVNISGTTNTTGTVTVGKDDTGHDVKFYGATSGRYLLWDESDDALKLTDNTKLKIGDSGDLEIYHDGSNSYIDDAGTGTLKYRSGTQTFSNADSTKTMAVFNASNSVDLNYNNSKKFETTNTGVEITGEAYATTQVSSPIVSGTNITAAGNVNISGTTNFDGNITYPNARFFVQTTGAIKLLASNNWAGFNRTTGGLDSSGFWNVDTGSGTIGTAYNYYGSYRNTFFTVPYACKLTRMVIQGANTTNSEVGQDWNIHLAKSPVVDGSDSISWAAVTGVTKTLPDNRDKRFIYDIPIDQNCAQFDTFLLAFQGTNSADTWLSMNVILEFEYTLT